MSIQGVRAAFNETTGPEATASLALMEYRPSGGVEQQFLIFSGSFADGAGFVIESSPVRPSGDLLAASRETATALLRQRTAP